MTVLKDFERILDIFDRMKNAPSIISVPKRYQIERIRNKRQIVIFGAKMPIVG